MFRWLYIKMWLPIRKILGKNKFIAKIYYFWIRKKMNKLTPKLISDFNDMGIKYHLVCGTLLFFFRDRNFQDTDIDFGVFDYEMSQNNIDILSKNGYRLERLWTIDGKIKEMVFYSTKYRTNVDLFILSAKDRRVFGFDDSLTKYSTCNFIKPYKLDMVKFNKLKFYIPHNSDEYLRTLYGNYIKKDPDFHWWSGSKEAKRIIIESDNIIFYDRKELESKEIFFNGDLKLRKK